MNGSRSKDTKSCRRRESPGGGQPTGTAPCASNTLTVNSMCKKYKNIKNISFKIYKESIAYIIKRKVF